MTPAIRFAAAVAALSGAAVAAQSGTAQFEVASIKRDLGSPLTFLSRPDEPNGQVRLMNVPVLALVLRAFPVETVPPDVSGLPSWADDERYDVIAKGKPGATIEEQQQMWRALLADRMKLAAHYEMRDKPTYSLVIANQERAKAAIKPSTLDCTQPQPTPPPPGGDLKTLGLSRCNAFGIDRDGTMYAGGVTMDRLAKMIGPTAGRPVIDRTGLTGYLTLALRYQRIPPRADAVPAPDDPPALFTALQEQLGLKLESATAQVRVLVVDHIERPDPD
jgi:uncharacterized protein (TIGR03435 family)